MRFLKSLICLVALTFLTIPSACVNQADVKQRAAMVTQLELDTAAIVADDPTHDEDEPEHRVVCTGVWVGPHKLLTAAHCTRINEKTVKYFTLGENVGANKEPVGVHEASLISIDFAHDLALALSGADDPGHGVARLAMNTPPVGDEVHVVGHVAGLNWTYYHGYVAAYRGSNFLSDTVGPFLQVEAPVYKGNSGGGAFDRYGELVGIADFLMRAPGTAFFIHLNTIREFLAEAP